MDSVIFLGGREHSIKELSEALWKETISIQTESWTRVQSESYGQNLQRLGKELLHLMVKSSVAQNKTNRDTIQLDFLQKACKVA